MEISIVIPAHNEEGNIVPLVNEIFHTIPSTHTFEILYVDDCSSDNTSKILDDISSQSRQVRYVKLGKQSGQSTALYIGVRNALHPLIVTLDGDGQNDPADIQNLLQPFMEGEKEADLLLVAGHRQNRQDSKWRCVSSILANTVRRNLLRDDTPDSGCGIKAFPRDLFLRLPAFNHIHRFLPALVLQAGGEVVSIPVNHRPRTHGVSKYGTWGRFYVGIFDLLGVMWLGKRVLNSAPEQQRAANG